MWHKDEEACAPSCVPGLAVLERGPDIMTDSSLLAIAAIQRLYGRMQFPLPQEGVHAWPVR